MGDQAGLSGKDLDEKAKKKQSWSLRMKKHLASKGASMDLGKKAVMHFLGDEGIVMLSSLRSAATKDIGKDKASDLVTAIFKMAFKFKFMFDEGTLNDRNTKHFEDPLNHLGVNILEYLDDTLEVQKQIEQKVHLEEESKEMKEAREVKEKEHKEAKEKLSEAYRPVSPTSKLVANFSRIRDMTIDLVSEWMTDKNIVKLRELFDYFGGERFLTLILTPEYKEERSQLSASLSLYLKPLMEHMKALSEAPAPTCVEADCDQPRVRPTKTFSGTKYCGKHHEERFRQIYLEAKLEHFLNQGVNGGTVLLFSQWLKQDKDADINLLSLYFSIDALKQIEQPKLKQTRAKLTFDKYINPYSKNAVKGIDAKIIETLEAKLDTDKIPDSAFKPVQDVIYTQLAALFEGFLKTDMYHSTAESLILPDKIRKQLGFETREQLLKDLEVLRATKMAAASTSPPAS